MTKKKKSEEENGRGEMESVVHPEFEAKEMDESIAPPEPPSKSFFEKIKIEKVEGVVISVKPTGVAVNVNGNGIKIPYVESKHANLKKGDKIEL